MSTPESGHSTGTVRESEPLNVEEKQGADDSQSCAQGAPVGPAMPIPEPSASGPPCTKCGQPRGRGNKCERCGAWLPGNQQRMEHGGYSMAVRQGLTPDAKASMATKRGQLLNDRGGTDECGQVEVDLIERYVELDQVARHLLGRLATEGFWTERGRMRAAFAAWLQVVDRWQRCAVILGLERRARDLSTMSITDYLAQEQARRQAQQAPQPAIGGADEVQPGDTADQAPDTAEGER